MVDVQNFNLVPNDEEEEFLVDFGEVNQITTTDFNKLENRPSYDNVTMTGDTNIPKVPSQISELSNDSDYQTGTEVESAINAAIGAIDIPSKTSDLTNDGADGTSTYVEADDLPPIPTVNDATLTITQNGTSKGTFTANDADDTTIELTDTTYTAGNAISIDNNNAISAAIHPEDFFTANATVTGTGSEIALQKTIPVKLVNVELDGDSFQNESPIPSPDYPQDIHVVTGDQTVNLTGKNLLMIDTNTRTSIGMVAKTNADTGIVMLNGTTTATAADTMYGQRTIEIKSGHTYVLSANNPVANSSVTLRLFAGGSSYPYELSLSSANATYKFTANADYNCRAQWRVSGSGVLLNRFTMAPMLEENTVATEFQPYHSSSFTIGLGATELCKIGDYQDYIYKSGNDWYVHKEIKEILCDGSENWTGENSNAIFTYAITDSVQPETNVISPILSNYYTANTYSDCYNSRVDYGVSLKKSSKAIAVRNKDFTGSSSCKAWFASNNTTFYYALATPTDTKITDAGLIAQLDALMDAKAYSDTTNIAVTATGINLPAILEVDAYTNSLAGIIGCLGDMA